MQRLAQAINDRLVAHTVKFSVEEIISSQNKHKNILFPLLAIMVLAVACNLSTIIQINPTQPPTTGPKSNTLPALSGDPKSIVANAIQILPDLSYRKSEWVVDGQGNPPDLSQPPVLVAEFTPPNNAYVVVGDDEYLALNGAFYTRKTGETWVSKEWASDMPGGVSQPTATNMAVVYIQALQKGDLTILRAGNDSIAGVPTQVFQVSGQMDFYGTPTTVAGKVWIGDDGRLVKMELDLPDNMGLYYLSLYETDPGIKMPTP